MANSKESQLAKTDPKKDVKKKKKGPNIFRRIFNYFKNMKSEIKKVTWLTKEEFAKYTGVVVAFIFIFAIVVFGIDSVLSLLVRTITG